MSVSVYGSHAPVVVVVVVVGVVVAVVVVVVSSKVEQGLAKKHTRFRG